MVAAILLECSKLLSVQLFWSNWVGCMHEYFSYFYKAIQSNIDWVLCLYKETRNPAREEIELKKGLRDTLDLKHTFGWWQNNVTSAGNHKSSA